MTKPIELGVKTAKGPNKTNLEKPALEKPAKVEKSCVMPGREEDGAAIMTLSPQRARKNSGKPEIFDQIGAHLGRVYNDVLNQPIPDRFLDLMQALETGECVASERATRAVGGAGSHIGVKTRSVGGRKKDTK